MDKAKRAGALSAALVLALSACGSSHDPAASPSAPKKTSLKPQKAFNPAERPPTDMIAAASTAKAGPVELKFELRAKPEVGQPIDIDIAILPKGPNLDRIQARFQSEDGLEIASGGELPATELAAPDKAASDKANDAAPPIRHVVQVVPKRDGIFTVTAAVTVDSANQPVTRTFSIPVIAGRGLPDLAAKSEVAAGPAPNSGANGAKTQ